MQDISLGPHKIGLHHPPFVIAEISGNHCGSLRRALELVDAAKAAGAHAVKLQTYTPDTITLDIRERECLIAAGLWKGRTLYELYQEAYTPWEWHQPIFEHCHEIGIVVFSSPFDETAVEFLENLKVPCYKIGSLEIVDHPLIEKAALTGKPLILSTAGATLAEIDEAVAVARKAGCNRLILMKCTTAHPAPPGDCHLRTIPHLMASFDTLVGLSDHTLGISVPIASVVLGACVIEKHITLARREGGVDAAFSLEPHEFKALVEGAKAAWEALGRIQYGPLPSEATSYSHRPSLYFVEDLPIGTIVQGQHIRSVRPSMGLLPKEGHKIIGLELKQSVKKGTPADWSLFK